MNSSSTPRAPITNMLYREWQALHCAITFLTRIPLPALPANPPLLAPAAAYFPLVGVFVATLGYLVFSLVSTALPHTIACLFAMISAIILTGAFHEDGLADTADGLGGGWQREDKLRIMKDSRLGTYGSVALFSLLAVKLLALTYIPAQNMFAALVLGHTLGRWSSLPLIHSCEYVGTTSSDGKPLVQPGSLRRSVVTSALTLGLILTLAPSIRLPVLISLFAIVLFSRWFLLRQIGGITGDTLGAVNQVIEAATYLLFAHFYLS
jgi:adenosylcobinamide-GDP ribazoletransferase